MTLEELIKTIQVAIVEAKWNYPKKCGWVKFERSKDNELQ